MLSNYSNNTNKSNVYNVNNYTDIELYNILDLSNPSDKILEAKILSMINMYRYINNEKGRQFTQFFKDIYERFFQDSEEDTDEEDNPHNSTKPPANREYFTNQQSTLQETDETDENSENEDDISNDGENLENTIQENFTNPEEYLSEYKRQPNTQRNAIGVNSNNNPFTNASAVASNIPNYVAEPSNTKIYSKFNIDNNVNTVTQVDYKKDTLNPILKQTIKRIINIDSSKRDRTTYTNSTNYSFNLSEPLRDVLSIKMYSIHIPYSWHTVNENFGGNFFYLKGNSPGINLGNADYKVEIRSGNYTPSELILTLNQSLQALKNTAYTDISFGTTSIVYNSNTMKTTINIDIKYLLNEKNFGFKFSDWTSPTPVNDNDRYNTTVASYLGYNYQTYDVGDIFSYSNLPSIANFGNESSETIYNVSSTNSIVYLLKADSYAITDTFINTIDTYITQHPENVIHTFDISSTEYGYRSRTRIEYEFSTILNSYNNSTITRIYIAGARSYYKLHINVYNNENIPNLKYILVFPEELTTPTIWTGRASSCFYFKKRVNIIGDIIAEVNSLQSNYVLPLSPFIELKCIADGYSNNPNSNTYTITIPATNTQQPNYTFDQYISVINSSIQSLPVLNSTTSGAFSNTSTRNRLKLRFDLTKRFSSSNYKLFFKEEGTFESIFITLFGLTQPIDGNINEGRFISDIPYKSTFAIPSNHILFKIIPATDMNAGNEGVEPFIIRTLISFSGTRIQTQNYIENLIKGYKDSITNTYPFQTSEFFLNINGERITVEFNLTVAVTLTERHYRVVFQDPNAGYNPNDSTLTNWGNGGMNTSTNTWYHDLKIPNQIYDLTNYISGDSGYSEITATDIVSGYELSLAHQETITFDAIGRGVYSPDDANTIKITIPAGTYTRSQLLSGLNLQLAYNQVTRGSFFFITIDPADTTRQYVNFRMNINKMFTSSDFLLVFYDPFSFAQCIANAEGGVRNAAWDSTIGWMIGFREKTEYDLSTIASISNIKTLVGDSVTTTFLYNYFMLILDDFTQNHINDGLVSINTDQKSINMIGGTHNNEKYTCDPVSRDSTYNPSPGETQRQIYTKSQILISNIKREKTYTSKPFIQNTFGIIPVKLSGLSAGSIYTEFGGTLQNQERVYFGPVNIFKMKIQLMNDRGEVVDLNNSDWSFSLICEQLYRQS